MSTKVIPVIDVAKFTHGSSEERSTFVNTLAQAFHEIGFVGIKNHGVPKSLIESFYYQSNRFFALPKEIKKKYEIEGMSGQRGYTSYGTEKAIGAKAADLKEFYQLGQEVADDHPNKSAYPDNIPLSEVPEFTKLGWELYQAFEKTGAHLLRAIAIHLKIGDDYFDQHIKNGTSVLRAIHYPPITEEPESAVRAEQHEDINLITLLVGASAGGLQLLSKEGEWQNIEPEENEIVINVGDMLQRLTNNYMKSTTHRVINPSRTEWHKPRLSIPFFLHPIAEMDLTCLSNCVDDEHPSSYAPITAGRYLDERLGAIGLKK